MRFGVTGATGFIGQAVLEECERRGHQVLAFVRPGARLAPSANLTVRTWDLADAGAPAVDGGEVDVLVHLAAHIPPRMDDPAHASLCFERNAVATHRLVRAAAAGGVRHVILGSAGTLYVNRGVPASEDDPMYPASHAPFYLASKLAAEAFAMAAARAGNTRLTSLRISSPYGRGMKAGSVVVRFLAQARAREPHQVTNPGHTADLVDVRDVAASVVESGERGVAGVYNIGTGVATSIAELSRLTREIAGDRSASGPVDSASAAGTGFPALDITRATQALGYQPTPLADGLRRMLRALS